MAGNGVQICRTMKQRNLIGGFLLALLPVLGFGQVKSAPLTKVEILGRLSIEECPSTIARAVRMRGIGFSISDDFLAAVKLAGGDGILVERLSTAGPSESSALNGGDGAYEHLAKCAEYLHKGDHEGAENECWASMDENPKSLWPIVAIARGMEDRDLPEEQKVELTRRITALLGDGQLAQGGTSDALPAEMTLAGLAKSSGLDNPGQYEELGPSLSSYGRYLPDGNRTTATTAPGSEGDGDPLLQQLNASDPDLSMTHLILGDYYQATGNPEKSASEIQEALRLEPDNSGLHEAIAQFYEIQQNFEGEISELREAVRIAPYGFRERSSLAEALERQGRAGEAIHEWRELTELSPGNGRASEALGALYIEQKEWAAAIAEYKRFLEVKPDSPGAENNLAWIYATCADPQYRKPVEALTISRRAVETSKEPDANAMDTLAEALLINGHAEEALETEERAAELAPGDAQIQSRLEGFQQAMRDADSAKH